MKNRTGYVFESNGKYYARITLTDAKGKRREIKRTAKSKTEANELLKQLIRQIGDEGEKVIDYWKMTFNDLADFYEKNHVIPAKYVNSQKVEGFRELCSIKRYLVIYREFFGYKLLKDILYEDISRFRSSRLNTITYRKTIRAMASVNRELAHLQRMFNVAIQQGWIPKNPFKCGKSLILASYERRRERILTLDDETRLLEACNHRERQHLKPLLIALLDTGCRKGEMLKLVWRDVNLNDGLITIQALNCKTLKERQVGITRRLAMELMKLWNKSNKSLDSSVFGISNNVRNSFKTACKIAEIKHGGLDGLTLHCLRHTAATRLVKGNLPIQLVGRILGHSQVNTTYRYLTADTDTIKQATNILQGFQSKVGFEA